MDPLTQKAFLAVLQLEVLIWELVSVDRLPAGALRIT